MTSRFPKPYADFVQRLRVPAGFLILGGFVLLARPSWVSILYSLPVIFVGMLLRGWAAGHLEKNEKLAVSGPYAYTRNPLYLGSLIVAGGFVVAAQSWWMGVLFLLVFVLVYLPVIEQEASHLAKLFGADYEGYASRVPLLLPWGSSGVASSGKRFSWDVFWRNKEQKAWYGALAGMGLLMVRILWMG
jgi:protein-S-isoprenylcysteine O-methyltransferase Ste14